MKKQIILPQIELNMESCALVRWLVKEGDAVKAEQPILEVETQKAVVEVPSSEGGYVRKLCVKAGDTIGEKALLCILTDTMDEPFDDPSATSSTPKIEPSAPLPSVKAVETEDGAVRAAPAARKLAKDLGVDLGNVKGSGPGGRITVEDVQETKRNVDGAGGRAVSEFAPRTNSNAK